MTGYDNPKLNVVSSSNYKISIIVPAYNVELYINHCLESLINQSLKEIEIIVINDASNDKTLLLIEEKLKCDDRIKLINYEISKSASQARKDGVKIASGEYIMFVDADDYLEINACEDLYKQIQEKNVDILQFGTNIISNGASESQIKWFENFSEPYIEKLFNKDIIENCFSKKNYNFNIWNKIYKSKLCKLAFEKIKDGYFPKAQDLYAYFIIAYFAESYIGIEDKYYNYSYGSGISGRNVFSKELFEKHCTQTNILLEIINFLISNNSLEQYQQSVLGVLNILFEDNFCSLLKINKNQSNKTFEPLEILSSFWIEGELLESLFQSLEKDIKNNTIYEIILEIIIKIYKNVPISYRSILLKKLEKLSNIKKDIYNIYSFDSKENLFFQIIQSYLKYSKLPNNTPIVFATDNNYAPYLGVTIQSLIDNSNPNYFYDILIFNSSLNRSYCENLENMSTKNIRINCVNVSSIIQYQHLYSKSHYSVEMYYRLLIAELLFFYSKVIYLDSDLIILDNINKLYDINIGENIIGAVHNPIHKGMYSYLSQKLNFNYKEYFNSGVLLINTEQFINNDIKNKCYEILKHNNQFACPDQDALNIACKNMIFEIESKWNFEWHHNLNLYTELIDEEKEYYKQSATNFSIIHYTSEKKPWNLPSAKYSDIFWHYAKKTIFYEEIIYKNTASNLNMTTQQNKQNIKPLKNEVLEITRKIIINNDKPLALEIISELKNHFKHKSLIKKFFISVKYEGIGKALIKTKNYFKRQFRRKK